MPFSRTVERESTRSIGVDVDVDTHFPRNLGLTANNQDKARRYLDKIASQVRRKRKIKVYQKSQKSYAPSLTCSCMQAPGDTDSSRRLHVEHLYGRKIKCRKKLWSR